MMSQSTSNSRKREKTAMSCGFCRRRKLRCNRQAPCSNCEARARPEECTYSSSEQERKNAVDYRPRGQGQKAQNRLAPLEQLVTEMKDREQRSNRQPDNIASQRTDPSEEERLIDSTGKLSIDKDGAIYTGNAHWATILEDIQNLKGELFDEQSTDGLSPQPSLDSDRIAEPVVNRPSLLTNTAYFTKDQMIAMVPPRKELDRRVAHFFNAFDMAPYLIYRQEFLSEYEGFWTNPSAAPTAWLGLLFGILSSSVFMQKHETVSSGLSGTDSQNIVETYRALTIQCLIASDYTRPSRYTMETLIFHFGINQNMSTDVQVGNWFLLGVIIRVAMRTGLHRDPSHWPAICPLEAELRRRHWMILYQTDFFTSAQVGLPRNIDDNQCDTNVPKHLFDQDLNFESKEMPPERPITDTTPLLYMIQRHKIVQVTAAIYDATEAAPPPPATIAALETRLQEAIDAIPMSLRHSALETSITDDMTLMLHRIFLDVLIQKAVYLLHRRSFMKDVKERNPKSNELCIDAALIILGHQRRVIEETQPGGLLFSNRWKVARPIKHESLQATMLLCLALSRFKDATPTSIEPSASYKIDEILESLKHAQSLWEGNAEQSVEAQRAAAAIAAVLKEDASVSSGPALLSSDDISDQVFGIAAPGFFDTFDPWLNTASDQHSIAAGGDFSEFGYVFNEYGAQRW